MKEDVKKVKYILLWWYNKLKEEIYLSMIKQGGYLIYGGDFGGDLFDYG